MAGSLLSFPLANSLLDDFELMNSTFLAQGYLFFRDVLDRDAVLRAKQDIVRVLQDQGIARRGETEPLWTGSGVERIDDNPLYALDSCRNLLQLKTTCQFVEKIFGAPVFMYQNTDIRFSLPNDQRHLTPPHQDHFFIRQTDRFRTVWIPLMDIDPQMGGLALAPGSHLHGLLAHEESETVYSYIFRGRKQRGVSSVSGSGDWLTIHYRPGDLLIFHSLMVHRALPNTSDRIRLSLDARYQPRSDPRTWQSERTIPELRKYRQEVQKIAFAEGLSEEQFESVLIEMMKRGLNAEAQNVRDLLETSRFT